MKIKLSERLQKIVNMVPNAICVGDVGTDHAYIPIELININKCKYAIASDIGSGPLINAQKSISFMGLEEKIQIRQGSGLQPYHEGEIDSVILAGMGGELICDILRTDADKLSSIKYFIFQPMTAQDELRRWLLHNGFMITKEMLAKEAHHIYEIFLAEHGQMTVADDILYEIGVLPFTKGDKLAYEFIQKKIHSEYHILNGLKKAKRNEKTIINIQKSQEKIHKLEEMLLWI